jgi:hypothetical protein
MIVRPRVQCPYCSANIPFKVERDVLLLHLESKEVITCYSKDDASCGREFVASYTFTCETRGLKIQDPNE